MKKMLCKVCKKEHSAETWKEVVALQIKCISKNGIKNKLGFKYPVRT